ncbi:MocR-like pyridoxine biosynthesis transcription factor PdxR [Bacillus sp. T33-2]|uniref:MocR-like pyridoxine biosynthesis transcription factor PdxR n=1 Tax=Bacillus sp. T33-2 TaxID=2054168 RepID=UPI000C7668A8|nr:PLP-dependent aminotransferase family protein [Bacillus sp. T33-2]PLR99257.1 PLP-dependent aminotransferase family protein [Bacillus sp. T33-2]
MILPALNTDSPHYIQIYDFIKLEIIKGNLAVNDKLPSIRTLADFLNISTTPVEIAYEHLLSEGLIQSRPRSGYFVQEIPAPYLMLENQSAPANDPAGLYPYRDRNIYPFDFHMSSNDHTMFPLKVWKKLYNQVLTEECLGFGDPQGEIGLRNGIASYLYQFRGVKCSPEQIIVAGDQSMLIFILANLLKKDYKDLAIENPGYFLIPSTFSKMGFDIHPIPLESDGLNVDALYKSNSRIVTVTPSYQFPTGKIMTIEKRMKLLQWAQTEKGFIIEDDYDGEFHYYGKPVPALQGLAPDASVVYLGGFSQVLSPAISIHYLVLPKKLVFGYHQLRIELMLEQSASRIHQNVLEMFIEGGFLAKHVRKMRNLYKKKQDALLAAIEKYLKGKVAIESRNGGFHILITVDDQRNAEELVLLAKQKGVRVANGAFYWSKISEEQLPTIMIGFAGIPLDKIDEGIKTLRDAWL